MTKQFYIATKKDREAQANAISEALKNQGWRRTYTWTAQEPGAEDQHSKIAQDELSAVRDADVLIVLLPGGFGTHVEIGMEQAGDFARTQSQDIERPLSLRISLSP